MKKRTGLCMLTLIMLALVPAAGRAETTIPSLEIRGGDNYVDLDEEAVSRSLVIENVGGGVLEWFTGDIDYQQAGGWITDISPRSGETEDFSIITIEVSREGLLPGVYRAKFPIVSNGGTEDVIVNVEVPFDGGEVPLPELTVDRSTLGFGLSEKTQSLEISNSGAGELSWEIRIDYETGEEADWLTVSSDSGKVPALQSTSVVVSVVREDLPPGNYSATLTVSSEYGTAELPAGMAVPTLETEVELVASADRLMFLKRSVTEQELILKNGLSADMVWSLKEISYIKDEGWLEVIPEQGYLLQDEEAELTVRVSREGLKAGLYIANMLFEAHDHSTKLVQMIMWVPVF